MWFTGYDRLRSGRNRTHRVAPIAFKSKEPMNQVSMHQEALAPTFTTLANSIGSKTLGPFVLTVLYCVSFF